MGYLISAWNETQKKFTMSLKQIVNIAGDGTLENEESIGELREFFSLIDLQTMERLLSECYSKDKKYKFDTRGFAFQDLINEMGRRLGYKVQNGLYRGKKNEIGFDGIWESEDGSFIVMESKTSDDYSISVESVIGYRDKLILEHKLPRKKCSILIVYGRDDRNALRNTVKGSDDAKNIRLISANALFQLVKLVVLSKSETVRKQVFSMLKPKDFFVLDNLVELVFPQTDDEIPDIDDADDESDIKRPTTPPRPADYINKATMSSADLLPESGLKIGLFVRTAMENLSASGYAFSDEEMRMLCEEKAMNKVIGMQRNMPFFMPYADDVNHRRYYAKPLTFGKHIVFLNSQLYESDRVPFVAWFKKHCES